MFYEVIRFYIKCIAEFIGMLFKIDFDGISLGTLMIVFFVVVPAIISFVTLFKYQESAYEMREYRNKFFRRNVDKEEKKKEKDKK